MEYSNAILYASAIKGEETVVLKINSCGIVP